ncbi:MAG: SDR family oxidoreductase [Gordonia sp. (in: high G+C Gram-positive bacteria)]
MTRAVTSRIGYLRGVPAIDPSDAVVIVTGGARGIGAETAKLFAANGATVWIGDLDENIAKDTATTIPGAVARRLDVTDRGSWALFLDEILHEHGRIDVLVNNAGVMPVGPFADEPEATTDLILDVNVRGVLNGMHAVLPLMAQAGRGHVVNISSMAGMIPLPGMVSYNTSKYAALGGSLAARREYDGTGVTVSAIMPAAVRTELSSGADLSVLPTVDPQDVARQVLRTLATRAAKTSAPTWVLPGWGLVEAFVPETVERFARRLINHDQAMALDPVGRKDYLERIERHADQNASVGGRTTKKAAR